MADDLGVAVPGGPVESGAAVHVAGVEGEAPLGHKPDSGRVVVAGGGGEMAGVEICKRFTKVGVGAQAVRVRWARRRRRRR